MKFNSQVLLKPTSIASILVICSSLLIGIASAILSFHLGSKSLEGVTSPPENPTQKINNKTANEENIKDFQLISEKTILVKVYDYIEKERKDSKITEKENK